MSGGKTWLERRNARKAREAAQAESRIRRAADEAERMAANMDRREIADLSRDLTKRFVEAGHCTVDTAVAQAERRRVRELLNRDRADAARETARAEAEKAMAAGSFVNLADAVVEPTSEWLEKGEVQSFTPRSPDGTARSVSTVRRVQTPIVIRMHRSGKLSDEHVLSCVWYRNAFEFADLAGHSASSQWNPNSTIRRGAIDAGFGYVPASEAVAEARDEYRAARDMLPAASLRFFEAIVLDDLPLRRAARFARCRDDRAQHQFRTVCERLHQHLLSAKASLPAIEGEKIA